MFVSYYIEKKATVIRVTMTRIIFSSYASSYASTNGLTAYMMGRLGLTTYMMGRLLWI